jgi:prophage tail gpP-like protein
MSLYDTDLDSISVVNLKTGEEFRAIEQISLTSEFLTPCDSFTFSTGAEASGVDIGKKFAPGSKLQFLVNGTPQMTGFVDSIELSCDRGGTFISVQGRDVLSTLVDSNIDPRMQVPKSPTIAQLAELVIVKQFGLEVGFAYANDSRVQGRGTKPGEKPKPWKGSRHKQTDPLKEVTPKDNEGAFTYLSRIFTHHGYWMWASVDGTYVVIAGPDYEQPPSYDVINRFDTGTAHVGSANNVTHARFALDETGIPSQVFVRGVPNEDAAAVTAMYKNPLASRFKPVYIRDQLATNKEKAERIARTFAARQQRNYCVYECTVAGFSDPVTKNIWQVDSVARVRDEILGLEGNMWIESRTFSKSRGGGTTTQLKLIPPGTILLDWQPDEKIEAPTSYVVAQDGVGDGAPVNTGSYGFGINNDVQTMQGKF